MKRIIITTCALLLLANIAQARIFHGGAANINHVVPVLATQPKSKDLTPHTGVIGNLTSPKDIWISNKYDAYIKGIYFTEGEHVKTGQILITLDNSRLKAAFASSKIAYESAKRDDIRMLKLAKDGYLSRENR